MSIKNEGDYQKRDQEINGSRRETARARQNVTCALCIQYQLYLMCPHYIKRLRPHMITITHATKLIFETKVNKLMLHVIIDKVY